MWIPLESIWMISGTSDLEMSHNSSAKDSFFGLDDHESKVWKITFPNNLLLLLIMSCSAVKSYLLCHISRPFPPREAYIEAQLCLGSMCVCVFKLLNTHTHTLRQHQDGFLFSHTPQHNSEKQRASKRQKNFSPFPFLHFFIINRFDPNRWIEIIIILHGISLADLNIYIYSSDTCQVKWNERIAR